MASRSPESGTDSLPTVVRRSEFESAERASTRVLVTLDSLPDFDVESSEEVLFESVDPDALDALFRSTPDDRSDGWVSFPVADYEVSVSAGGEVVVRSAPN